MGLFNFKSWESIFESHNHHEEDIKKITASLKDDMGEIYAVPNFEIIKKQSEPTQHRAIYTNKKLNVFALNYLKSGVVYSVDFWKSGFTSPTTTMYANGLYLDDLIPYIPYIAVNPHPDLDIEKIKKNMKEPVKEAAVDEAELIARKHKTDKDFRTKVMKTPIITKAKPETQVMDENTAKIESEYEFGDPDKIFDELRNYTDMVIKNIQPSLLITGSTGVGKSFIVRDQLDKAGLKNDKDYIKIKGKATAAAMYISLYENNGKLIIFDDCDSVLRNEDGINILKGALDASEEDISWSSAKPIKGSQGETVPHTFKFTGRVIFISNIAQKALPAALKAIKSRSFVIEVALKPEDMVRYIEGILDKIHPEISMSIKEYALKRIKVAAKKNPKVELNLSTLVKAARIIGFISDPVVANEMIEHQCAIK